MDTSSKEALQQPPKAGVTTSSSRPQSPSSQMQVRFQAPANAAEHLRCQICKNFFDEEERVPRLMPNCGHSFCHACVSRAIKMKYVTFGDDNKKGPQLDPGDPTAFFLSPNGELQCPEDDIIMNPQIQSAEELPQNFALIKLVQKKNKQKPQAADSLNTSQSVHQQSKEEQKQQNIELVKQFNQKFQTISLNLQNIQKPKKFVRKSQSRQGSVGGEVNVAPRQFLNQAQDGYMDNSGTKRVDSTGLNDSMVHGGQGLAEGQSPTIRNNIRFNTFSLNTNAAASKEQSGLHSPNPDSAALRNQLQAKLQNIVMQPFPNDRNQGSHQRQQEAGKQQREQYQQQSKLLPSFGLEQQRPAGHPSKAAPVRQVQLSSKSPSFAARRNMVKSGKGPANRTQWSEQKEQPPSFQMNVSKQNIFKDTNKEMKSPKFSSAKFKFGLNLENKNMMDQPSSLERDDDDRTPDSVRIRGKDNKPVAIPKFNMLQLQESVEKDTNAEEPLFHVVQNSAKFMQHEGDQDRVDMDNFNANPFDLDEQDAAEFDFAQGRVRGPTFGGDKNNNEGLQHQRSRQRERENEQESDLAGRQNINISNTLSFSKKPPQHSEEEKLGHTLTATKPNRPGLVSTQQSPDQFRHTIANIPNNKVGPLQSSMKRGIDRDRSFRAHREGRSKSPLTRQQQASGAAIVNAAASPVPNLLQSTGGRTTPHSRSTSQVPPNQHNREISPDYQAGGPNEFKVCLEHGKLRSLICIDCQQHVCETCALFGSHQGHDVRQTSEVMNDIKLRMELLMENYQAVQQDCQALQDMNSLNEKYHALQCKKQDLEEQATAQINAWKDQLDRLLINIKNRIAQAFMPFEVQFQTERGKLYEVEQEGYTHQDKIHEVLDLYTAEIERNPNYIAFGLLNTDPLNDNSVECMCTQTEIWEEQVKQKLHCEALGQDLAAKYNALSIQFDEGQLRISDKLFQVVDASSEAEGGSKAKPPHQMFQRRSSFKEIQEASGSKHKHARSTHDIARQGQEEMKEDFIKVQDGQANDADQELLVHNQASAQSLEFDVNQAGNISQEDDLLGQSPAIFKQLDKVENLAGEDIEGDEAASRMSPNQSGFKLQLMQQKAEANTVDRRAKNKSMANTDQLDLAQRNFGTATRPKQDLKKSFNVAPSAPVEPGLSTKQSLVSTLKSQVHRQTEFNPGNSRGNERKQNSTSVNASSVSGMSKTNLNHSIKDGTANLHSRTNSSAQPKPNAASALGKPPTTKQSAPGGSPSKKGKINSVQLTEAFKTQASESGRIDLSQKGLADMHTTTLANLIKSNTGIKSLDLSGNRISDEGIMAVIKALCESQIEVVSLAKNKLTDACSEQIAQTLKSNKHLKYLDLSENNIANRVSKNKLKNSLKKIEVVV